MFGIIEETPGRERWFPATPTAVRYSATEPIFWSLVRPDRILPPITRSAAVTTSLEAGELAVGMSSCERSRRRLLEFDRLINDWLGRFFGPATCQSPRTAASREAFQSPGGSKKISNP
jgi:hypothetical protein